MATGHDANKMQGITRRTTVPLISKSGKGHFSLLQVALVFSSDFMVMSTLFVCVSAAFERTYFTDRVSRELFDGRVVTR